VQHFDIPWENKLNNAVFRGMLTGAVKDLYSRNATDEAKCMSMPRCKLVYVHDKSTIVNARLTSTRNLMPARLDGVKLVGKAFTMQHLLQFKGLIMLEGNDVASGLKWALLSNSVVLMPEPKYTSWAMEEWLEPWVHYVPLNDELTDVEEKMRWIVKHDAKARQIARRGTLWMYDMVFHPDAAEDDRRIQDEILRRYFRHFSELAANATMGQVLPAKEKTHKREKA
jgi:hypothetical protein